MSVRCSVMKSACARCSTCLPLYCVGIQSESRVRRQREDKMVKARESGRLKAQGVRDGLQRTTLRDGLQRTTPA